MVYRKIADPLSAVRSLPGVVEVHGLIGVGSFSHVFSCTLEGLETVAAVKLLSGPEKPLDENREVRMLMRLQHPNLVRLLRVVEGPPHALALDLCVGGCLQELLHGSGGGKIFLSKLGTQARARAALDAALAVEYLHDQNIVHRDVKSGNCFLSRVVLPDCVELPPVKLGDLGFARSVTAAVMTRGIGTVRYMAPEVISSGSYGLPADVYSCGVLLHELLSGEMPYGNMRINSGALAIAILSGKRPPMDALPEEVRGTDLEVLLQECFDAKTDARPGSAQLLARLGEGVGRFPGRD